MNTEERDYEQFPDDSNGAVLWHMRSKGDSLTTPREVDFTALFPSEEAALKFAVRFLRDGWKVEMFETEPNSKNNLVWAVMLYTTIVPTHLEISELEEIVTKCAQELGGGTNGWSSVFVKSP